MKQNLILSRFAEQKGIINSLCVRWGHSIRLLSIIEERFKQRCELSINCNNCYAGLLTKINKESLVENDLTDLSLYSEREKLICDQKKKIAELERKIKALEDEYIKYHSVDYVAGIARPYEQRIAELEKQIAELEKDNKRLDWLADKNNHIGNVMLPTQCVVDNLSSLRGAIDAAMEMDNE